MESAWAGLTCLVGSNPTLSAEPRAASDANSQPLERQHLGGEIGRAGALERQWPNCVQWRRTVRTRERSVRLARLAARQFGIVSRRQLWSWAIAHVTNQRILSRQGRLHRLHPGVYAVGHVALTRTSHLVAALFWAGKDAALSHVTAAEWWGLCDERRGPDPHHLAAQDPVPAGHPGPPRPHPRSHPPQPPPRHHRPAHPHRRRGHRPVRRTPLHARQRRLSPPPLGARR